MEKKRRSLRRRIHDVPCVKVVILSMVVYRPDLVRVCIAIVLGIGTDRGVGP